MTDPDVFFAGMTQKEIDKSLEDMHNKIDAMLKAWTGCYHSDYIEKYRKANWFTKIFLYMQDPYHENYTAKEIETIYSFSGKFFIKFDKIMRTRLCDLFRKSN